MYERVTCVFGLCKAIALLQQPRFSKVAVLERLHHSIFMFKISTQCIDCYCSYTYPSPDYDDVVPSSNPESPDICWLDQTAWAPATDVFTDTYEKVDLKEYFTSSGEKSQLWCLFIFTKGEGI